MRKLSKKISMLMVLAMLVSLFSGVVSASAASAWSFKSKKYDAVAVDETIIMGNKEYADFDLLKDGKAPTGYTVTWASSDENVVWVNAKTGQLRVNKLGMANLGDEAEISATFTNTKTGKSATRSFVISYETPEFTVEAEDVTIALGEEVKFAPVVKDADENVVKFATHKSYNGYFLDGKKISNPWTPEEAGEYTITVAQFSDKALTKKVRETEVTVTVTLGEFTAEATGIKEITVYGDFEKNSTFTVAKDGVIKIATEVEVAEDLKSATLTLVNSRIGKGEYSVTCGDVTAKFVGEDERVESIVILEDKGEAYTSADRSKAYAHYDVFNQYDESIRKSVDVSFSSSADRLNESATIGNPNTGIVTMNTNPATNPFNYSNVLVLTATVLNYNGSTKTATANMTVGLQNNIHTVAVKGVVLKDTNELLDAVPIEFVGGDYYMVFECYDRDGRVMEYDHASILSDLTFVSVSPLLGSVATPKTSASVIIDDVEYGMIKLVAGQDAKKGGDIDIKVTSQSGGVSDVKVRVGSNQILQSFRVIKPETVVAVNKTNGDPTNDLELKYEALDSNGKKITDFRALYEAVAFSTSRVKLVENNDGSAKLVADVSGLSASKQVDAQLIFSVIIPGVAKAENVTLNVKYARHPEEIGSYEGNFEVLEGDAKGAVIGLAHKDDGANAKINFIDQYDEVISRGAFAGYKVGAKVTTACDNGANPGLRMTGYRSYNTFDPTIVGDYMVFNPAAKESIKLTSGHVTGGVAEGVIEVVLIDPVYNTVISGSAKKFTIKIVDLSQVVSFSISPAWKGGLDQSKLQNKVESTNDYEVFGYLDNGHQVCIPLAGTADGASWVEFDVHSYGSYGDVYADVATGASLKLVPVFDVDNDVEVKGTSGSALQIFQDKSRYDVEGQFARVNREIVVKAKIFTVDNINGNTYKGSASSSSTVGVDKRAPEVVIVKAPTAVVNAKAGKITYADLVAQLDKIVDNYGDNVNFAEVAQNVDGCIIRKDLTLTISNFKEGKKGLDFDDAVIKSGEQTGIRKSAPNGNAEPNKEYPRIVMIENAEIGDTFTVTYACEGKTASVDFTVGADKDAHFYTINPNLLFY